MDRIGEKPKRTWDEACIRWLNEKGHKKSIKEDKQMIRRLTALRGMYLDDITRDLVMDTVKDFGRTNATKNRFIQLIRAILNRAMKQWEWLETVPYFSLYSEPKCRIRWLTTDEAQRLIATAPPYLSRIIRFSLSTGLRRSNVQFLRWSQIDLNRKVAWFAADNMKSGRPLGVSLNEPAMQVLYEQQGKHDVFVFTNSKGTPLKNWQWRDWKMALKKAEIENFRFHDLRHTWASWLVQRGVPLVVLQEMGGWESVSMVQRYAHLAPDHLHKHSALLNNLLE
ncbi:MAG: site-specific integrase [Neisseriaceae bacterium]|nr:site-specific integrase [Neisseriaceae bacterium]